MPLTSIVITAYNQAHFLGSAIESALNQTVSDREILVIDDGSTDDAVAVVRSFDGVTYVRQDNLGLSAARNKGLHESRGEYLVFLDADDRLLPTALAAGLRCFSVYPDSAFVSGRHQHISSDGSLLGGPSRANAGPATYEALLRGNYVGMHATVMYRRSMLLRIGGFDTELAACEDYDLYLRAARIQPVARHNDVVAEYRMHADNMSRDAGRMLTSALRVLERQQTFVEGDPHLQEAFSQGRQEWRRYYARKALAAVRSTRATSNEGRRALRNAYAVARLAPGQVAARLAASAKRRLMNLAPVKRLRRMAKRGDAPRAGTFRFGDFRRLTPVSRHFGYDRGRPIDRYYIEAFLARNAETVRGRVLEVGDNSYTLRFGGARVTKSEVLHVDEDHPTATYIGDLAQGADLPSSAFDCVILTQTLHLIYDLRPALSTLERILKPGGAVLITVPGTISQLETGPWSDTWYWGFTKLSIDRLASDVFEDCIVEIQAHGSVLTSVAFLQGLSSEELRPEELEFHDPYYPLLITASIRKPAGSSEHSVPRAGRPPRQKELRSSTDRTAR